MMPMCAPEDARWHVLLVFRRNDGCGSRVVNGYYPWFPGLDQFSSLCPLAYHLESVLTVRTAPPPS